MSGHIVKPHEKKHSPAGSTGSFTQTSQSARWETSPEQDVRQQSCVFSCFSDFLSREWLRSKWQLSQVLIRIKNNKTACRSGVTDTKSHPNTHKSRSQACSKIAKLGKVENSIIRLFSIYTCSWAQGHAGLLESIPAVTGRRQGDTLDKTISWQGHIETSNHLVHVYTGSPRFYLPCLGTVRLGTVCVYTGLVTMRLWAGSMR